MKKKIDDPSSWWPHQSGQDKSLFLTLRFVLFLSIFLMKWKGKRNPPASYGDFSINRLADFSLFFSNNEWKEKGPGLICGLALTRSLLWKKSTCQVQILIAFQELGRIWTGHWQVPDPMIFEKRELVDQPPQIFLRKWAVDYGLDKFFYFFPNLRLEEIRTCPKTIAQPIIILWSRRLGDKSLFLFFSRCLEKKRK